MWRWLFDRLSTRRVAGVASARLTDRINDVGDAHRVVRQEDDPCSDVVVYGTAPERVVRAAADEYSVRVAEAMRNGGINTGQLAFRAAVAVAYRCGWTDAMTDRCGD